MYLINLKDLRSIAISLKNVNKCETCMDERCIGTRGKYCIIEEDIKVLRHFAVTDIGSRLF